MEASNSKLSACPTNRLTWMVQPLSVLDFVALLPFYLEICFELMCVGACAGIPMQW